MERWNISMGDIISNNHQVSNLWKFNKTKESHLNFSLMVYYYPRLFCNMVGAKLVLNHGFTFSTLLILTKSSGPTLPHSRGGGLRRVHCNYLDWLHKIPQHIIKLNQGVVLVVDMILLGVPLFMVIGFRTIKFTTVDQITEIQTRSVLGRYLKK